MTSYMLTRNEYRAKARRSALPKDKLNKLLAKSNPNKYAFFEISFEINRRLLNLYILHIFSKRLC